MCANVNGLKQPADLTSVLSNITAMLVLNIHFVHLSCCQESWVATERT